MKQAAVACCCVPLSMHGASAAAAAAAASDRNCWSGSCGCCVLQLVACCVVEVRMELCACLLHWGRVCVWCAGCRVLQQPRVQAARCFECWRLVQGACVKSCRQQAGWLDMPVLHAAAHGRFTGCRAQAVSASCLGTSLVVSCTLKQPPSCQVCVC